jgi:hypothetical protein
MRTLNLTAGSIRRALDRGTAPAQVRTLLAHHSDQPLPNTVETLLADVQAKHGRVRVGNAGFYVTVDDPHLLVELQADKQTAGLLKRVIAPTVALVEGPSLDKILEKLRGAGHMPVIDADKPPARKTAALTVVPPSQPAKTPSTAAAGVPEGERTSNPDAITAILEQAERKGRPVQIQYAGRVKGRESISERYVEVYEIVDGALYGYDYMQEREREFKLARIQWARLATESEATNLL